MSARSPGAGRSSSLRGCDTVFSIWSLQRERPESRKISGNSVSKSAPPQTIVRSKAHAAAVGAADPAGLDVRDRRSELEADVQATRKPSGQRADRRARVDAELRRAEQPAEQTVRVGGVGAAQHLRRG